MPRNGSGTYSRAVTPPVNGDVADADLFNDEMDDFATAITNSLARNGEATPTANLPMGGFVHTGLGAGKSSGQSMRFEQFLAIDTGGSSNAYTLTSGSSLSAYTNGQAFLIKASFTNTGAATLNVDGIGAKNIYIAGAALAGGEIVSGRIYTVSYDGTQFQVINGAPSILTAATRRQTVLSGAKDSSGFPAFFAAGSGLRLALDATPTNLRIAFADGANGDLITTLTADASDMLGADVPASVRSYVYAQYASAVAVTWNFARKAPQYGTKLDRAALGSILHFEGADGSTSIIDDYGNTWTASGNAQIDTAQSSVGSSSLLLDGTGDYITTTDISVIGDPSTGAFTRRGRVRFNVLPTAGNYMCLASAFNSAGYGANIHVHNNAGSYQLLMFISSNGSGSDISAGGGGNITVTAGVWYDWAFVYDDVSGHYRVYWEGVQRGAQASALKVCPISSMGHGATLGAGNALNGWLDECVYEPYCMYPAGTTFTPPATAFAVNGHWYDIDSGTMYEVTSASASAGTNPGLTARQRVFVGEAIAGASTISSVVNYAYQGRYDSGLFAVAVNTSYAKNHNIGIGNSLKFNVNFSPDAAGRNEQHALDYERDAVPSDVGYFMKATSRTQFSVQTAFDYVGYNSGSSATSGYYRILADRGF